MSHATMRNIHDEVELCNLRWPRSSQRAQIEVDLQGSNKIEVDVKEAGDDELKALGIKIVGGAKVVAVLNDVAGKTAMVRFMVK